MVIFYILKIVRLGQYVHVFTFIIKKYVINSALFIQ